MPRVEPKCGSSNGFAPVTIIVLSWHSVFGSSGRLSDPGHKYSRCSHHPSYRVPDTTCISRLATHTSLVLERVDEGTDTLEPDLHLLAILDDALGLTSPSDTARGAHLDDCASLEGCSLAQMRNRLSAAEDHVTAELSAALPSSNNPPPPGMGYSLGVGLLHGLSGQHALEGKVVWVDSSSANKHRADGARLVEALAEAPLRVGELMLSNRDVVGSGHAATG